MRNGAWVLAAGFAITMFVLAARFRRVLKRGDMPFAEYAARTCAIWGCLLAVMTSITFAVSNGPFDQLPVVVPVLAAGTLIMFAVAATIRTVMRSDRH